MKKREYIFLASCLIGLSTLSCKNESNSGKDSYLLLDSKLPCMIPEIFAPDRISRANRFEQYASFSPDGKAFYFSYTDSAWGKSTIIQIDVNDPSREQKLVLVKSDYQSGQFVDHSGKGFYFTAIIPENGFWQSDIFMAEKKGNSLNRIKKLDPPVNSYICEWHPTITETGILYFASERNYDHGIADIYKALPGKEKGNYDKVEKLASIINSEYNETDPLIAPDESFLIFASNRPNGVSGPDMYLRPNGYDELDLYISFNRGNTGWSVPKNMGTAVNTDSWEFAPALSPDQKYLFFTRREAFNTLDPSKIYWIDCAIIDKLRD